MKNINKYIKKLELNKVINNLNDAEVYEILKLSVVDFKNSEISLDDLTEICEILWSEIYHQNKISGESINLVSAGLDLQYNLRRIDNDENAKIFVTNLKMLLSLV